MAGIKTGNLIKALPLAIILLLACHDAFSQVAVERSGDKVIISGVPYYVHQVKKGETVYSISKAYGITVGELTKENPPAVYSIKEGQTLRIPVKPVTGTAPVESPAAQAQHDDSKFIYHKLNPGETIYFLSKSFGVSENDIVQSNPGIDINKLPVGSEIAIPKKQFMSNREKFDDQEKPVFFHKVENGESLSSIAERYGVSVREIRKANRDLRFPQVGDSLRIPGMKLPEKQEVSPVAADTAMVVVPEQWTQAERPEAYTPLTKLSGSINVAVLLPFYLKENSARMEIDSSASARGKKLYKVTKRNDDWIYPGSYDFIEMYNGILMAADTLRSLGMDVNIHAWDIKDDTVGITRLIDSGKLEGMDLIIGPVYSGNLSLVAEYAKRLGIPVVSPVPLYNNYVLKDNPEVFLASSSLGIAQQKLAKMISRYPDHNIVFIHADTTGVEPAVQNFKRLILEELSSRIPFEDIRFKEFLFYSRSMFDNDSINRLAHALSEQTKNIVVIASEDAPVISETIIDIHSLSRRYDLKVFGYPAMRDIDNLDPKYFFDLDLMLYTPYWIDYSRQDVRQFNSDYRKIFLTEPGEKSYAWQGYDIARYFISGLALHGKEFLIHPEIHHPELLQTDFDFERKTATDGFENRNLILIRYTRDYEVKRIDEKNPEEQH
jgi:LysM repeat protein